MLRIALGGDRAASTEEMNKLKNLIKKKQK